MRRPLTAIAVQNLKPGAARREVSDPGARGLYVVVQPSGTKSFAIRYRYAGKTRKMTLPSGTSLAVARKAAADAMYRLERGHDPAAPSTRQVSSDALQAVAERYFRLEGSSLRSAAERVRSLKQLVYPVMGERPIGEIRRSEIIDLLDGIADEHGPVMAARVLAYVRRVFNWHAVRVDDFRSPIVRGMGRPKSAARSRILTDDELRAVWATAEAGEGPFNRLVQFILLTAARRSEAARMPLTELSGTDWILPAARNKAGVDLIRPLSQAAQDVLARTPQLCSFVFSTDAVHPISGFSKFKTRFDDTCGVTGWTWHDLRRTARSLMSRAGVPSDHAERCLGHVIGGVRGTYDRYEYRQEKAQAYEALAALIGIVTKKSV
jgi:integrase